MPTKTVDIRPVCDIIAIKQTGIYASVEAYIFYNEIGTQQVRVLTKM